MILFLFYLFLPQIGNSDRVRRKERRERKKNLFDRIIGDRIIKRKIKSIDNRSAKLFSFLKNYYVDSHSVVFFLLLCFLCFLWLYLFVFSAFFRG